MINFQLFKYNECIFFLDMERSNGNKKKKTEQKNYMK
jgi:hypothetical protein